MWTRHSGVFLIGIVPLLLGGWTQPAASATTAWQTRETYVLSNSEVRVSISKATGAVTGLWDLRRSERCVGPSADQYGVERPTRIGEITSFPESEDRVLSASLRRLNGGDIELAFTCANEQLDVYGPISIVKNYYLEATGSKLLKTMYFQNLGEEELVLAWHSSLTLDSAFRSGGYYYKPTNVWDLEGLRPPNRNGHSGPYPANQVVTEEPPFCGIMDTKLVACVSPQKGIGVGHYLYRVNNEFVFYTALGTDQCGAQGTLVYTPSGWRFGACRDFLKPKRGLSATVVLTVFRGDHLALLRQYLDIPEYRTLRGFEPPEWVRRIKANMSGDWTTIAPGSPAVEYLKWVAEMLGDGIVTCNFLWSTQGDYYTDRPCRTGDRIPLEGEPPRMMNPDDFAKSLRALKSRIPNLRVGTYQNLGYFDAYSEMRHLHPDWIITSDDFGKPVPANTSIWRDILASAGREYVLDTWAKQFEKFGLDYIYLDGGSEYTLTDWDKRRIIQPYHFRHFLFALRDIIREAGRDKAFHCNWAGAMPADFSYQELPGLCWETETWQKLADFWLVTKMFQPEGKPIIPLFWEPSYDREYVNYLLGLGFTPYVGYLNSPWSKERLTSRIPFIDAAYEINQARLIDADVCPCWWKDNVAIEAYCLQQGPARMVSLISNEERPVEVLVSANTKMLNLSPAAPIMIWLFEPSECTNLSDYVPLVVDRRFLGVKNGVDERIGIRLKLEPKQLRIILLTQSPALVCSVNGKGTQFLLPSTLGIDVHGELDSAKKEVTLSIDAQDDCKIMAIYPKAWGSQYGVCVDAHARHGLDEVEIDGERFIGISLSRGKHYVCISLQSDE